MEKSKIFINTVLDHKIFTDFAIFDTLIRSKKWLKISIFSVLMLIFALMNLYTDSTALFVVFLLVAILSPISYIYQFKKSIDLQINKYGLHSPKSVYTLTFSPNSQSFTLAPPEQEPQEILWESVTNVYMRKTAIYIYINQQQAYILPLAQIEHLEDLCVLLQNSVYDKDKIRYHSPFTRF